MYTRNSEISAVIRKRDSLVYENQAILEFIWLQYQFGLNIVSVYNSPRVKKSEAINVLKELISTVTQNGFPTIIMGDFNMKVESPAEIKLTGHFQEFGLNMIVERGKSSTDENTQLDLVYSNIPACAQYYESAFSYHKPVIISLRATK